MAIVINPIIIELICKMNLNSLFILEPCLSSWVSVINSGNIDTIEIYINPPVIIGNNRDAEIDDDDEEEEEEEPTSFI